MISILKLRGKIFQLWERKPAQQALKGEREGAIRACESSMQGMHKEGE